MANIVADFIIKKSMLKEVIFLDSVLEIADSVKLLSYIFIVHFIIQLLHFWHRYNHCSYEMMSTAPLSRYCWRLLKQHPLSSATLRKLSTTFRAIENSIVDNDEQFQSQFKANKKREAQYSKLMGNSLPFSLRKTLNSCLE